MKVAIFTDTFLPNRDGVVTSVCNTIKGLLKKGIKVVVFAPGEKTELKNYLGAKVYYIKGRDALQYPGYKIVPPEIFLTRILAFLEIEKPDVYHIHSPFSLGVAGLIFSSIFGKHVVGSYHTYFEDYAGYVLNGKFRKATWLIFGVGTWNYFRLVFNRCDYTISPTGEVANILRRKGFQRVVTVPSAVDFDFLNRQKKRDIRRKHKIPKSAKLILYVGRLGFEKKLNVLFNAMKLLDKNYYLLVIGKGPFEKKYKTYVKSQRIKNVVFTGFVKDEELASYYAGCDIFVSPSDSETQGLTLIEAMHFGKPVIGADKLGVREIIANGKNGLKFLPGNSVELAGKIKILANDSKLYRKIAKNARKFSRKFSIDNSAKKIIELYKLPKAHLQVADIRKLVNKRFKSILKFV
jgi:glycosyltransferase involved in cell wall biosynthesis